MFTSGRFRAASSTSPAGLPREQAHTLGRLPIHLRRNDSGTRSGPAVGYVDRIKQARLAAHKRQVKPKAYADCDRAGDCVMAISVDGFDIHLIGSKLAIAVHGARPPRHLDGRAVTKVPAIGLDRVVEAGGRGRDASRCLDCDRDGCICAGRERNRAGGVIVTSSSSQVSRRSINSWRVLKPVSSFTPSRPNDRNSVR